MSANLNKSQEWLAIHRATIGGSNAAAAVGLNPYKTPLSLYYEMVNGLTQNPEINPDMLRGILLESVARDRLSAVLDMPITEHDQDDFIRNPQYSWAHAIPDGWIVYEGERLPIELKVPHPRNWEKLNVEVPDYILVQAFHNFAVIAAPALMLGCLNPVTMEIYHQLYEPTQRGVDVLMEAEERFYKEHVVKRIPPNPQNHSDLKLRWPEHSPGKTVTATEDIEDALGELAFLRRTLAETEKRSEELSFSIKNFIADAETLVGESGSVLATYRAHARASLDVKRLKADMPEVYRQFYNKTQVRVFVQKHPLNGDEKNERKN